jgi:hypothetical protein
VKIQTLSFHGQTYFVYLRWYISDSVSWQVEHMLNDRLLNFVDVDLHDVKVTLLFSANTES